MRGRREAAGLASGTRGADGRGHRDAGGGRGGVERRAQSKLGPRDCSPRARFLCCLATNAHVRTGRSTRSAPLVVAYRADSMQAVALRLGFLAMFSVPRQVRLADIAVGTLGLKRFSAKLSRAQRAKTRTGPGIAVPSPSAVR